MNSLGVHFVLRIMRESNFDSPNVLEKLEERMIRYFAKAENE